MATLVKVTRNGQITIPAAIRQELDIQEGDHVEVSVVDDTVVLTPNTSLHLWLCLRWIRQGQNRGPLHSPLQSVRLNATIPVRPCCEDSGFPDGVWYIRRLLDSGPSLRRLKLTLRCLHLCGTIG